MRLKSLEIKGFKSFADKTVVNFDDNITGIVGPNGCGKSNIVDSIRWVIGEQKISQLRSENLESLVFNGSRTRSASGLAEVSLTFENTKNLLPTEFNTVTITRKFYNPVFRHGVRLARDGKILYALLLNVNGAAAGFFELYQRIVQLAILIYRHTFLFLID